MDCIHSGNLTICGNFAKIDNKKPDPFDYNKTSKWVEPYPFDWREVIGKTICNCKNVIVHFDPYFGFDYFHSDNCNLIKKINSEPGIQNLVDYGLPAIIRFSDSVPNIKNIPLYIKKIGRSQKIKLHRHLISPKQGVLV